MLKGAGFTKSTLFLTGLGTCLYGLFDIKSQVLFVNFKVGNVFVYDSVPELVLGSFIFYHYKTLERQLGLLKFISFYTSSVVISSVLMGLIGQRLNFTPNGPYSVLFSFAVIYLDQVPSYELTSLLGMKLTDKFIFKCLLVGMFFVNSVKSMVPAVVGIITGAILQKSPTLQSLMIPKWISNPLKSLLKDKDDPMNDNLVSIPPSQYQIREEDIQLLEGMGFERPKIMHALSFNKGNVQGAVSYLLAN